MLRDQRKIVDISRLNNLEFYTHHYTRFTPNARKQVNGSELLCETRESATVDK